tara:strand:+ start:160 stop:684 length:525 start_codon:yes stop_codon:yes gene_type:complete
MEVQNCSIADADEVLSLYQEARNLQRTKKMVVWPYFDKSFLENEMQTQRQWKIVIDGIIACNWAISLEDREIWGLQDKNDGIYIHRICTNPMFSGNRYINAIVAWAKEYAVIQDRRFVRLDTLGNNTRLIKHYTDAGFSFLGMFELTDTDNLPKHYQDEPNCCLFEIDIKAVRP